MSKLQALPHLASSARPGRISWARLLKRVFDIDMQRFSTSLIAGLLSSPLSWERLVPRAFTRRVAKGKT